MHVSLFFSLKNDEKEETEEDNEMEEDNNK
jgi:hypothetical protein